MDSSPKSILAFDDAFVNVESPLRVPEKEYIHVEQEQQQQQPRVRRKRKPSGPTKVPQEPHPPTQTPDTRLLALQNAAAGAAAAGVMTSAMSSRSASASNGPQSKSASSSLKPLVMTCAAIGMGAFYIGLLYFLYRKVVALEKSLHETMLEMKKFTALLDSDDRLLQDEPMPERWMPDEPESDTMAAVEDPVEEEEEEDPVDRITETLSNFHITTVSDTFSPEEEENQEDENPKVEELSSSPAKAKTKRKAATKTTTTTTTTRSKPKPKEKMVILDLDS